MIKDLKTYIETVNKSATSSVSGAEDTKVLALRSATLKGSALLAMLPDVTLTGKYTDIPFLHLPSDMDTIYSVGGIQVEKELLSASATLVDETTEDASPNLEAALDTILTSQARLKLEKYLADKLTTPTPTAGASSKNFATIVDTIKKFPSQALSIEGQFIAVTSPMTYFALLSTMDNAHREMVKQGIIKLVPLYGVADDALVVLHTQGVAFGFQIYNLEKDREASKGSTDLIVNVAAGFGYDRDYIKHVKLS
ncbi:hypothetical protein FDJ19_gp034 [Vibrio phage Ceto]|uniref:Major capsid protein n=1 Tax=Vibrio phage Ceto TaxID=2570300 RepID=A0A2H5BGD5_9CAUD|nr:hypothetical protein FDJ19_gp034 [Vibrio phage Ceto]AUG85041.1 hypothetical protein CETO_34 [Vibrio phage Ceto]